ncbi:hypothetical protein YC2023_116355 [Brassica napus]
MSQRRRYGAAHKGGDAARSSLRRRGGGRDAAASRQVLDGVRSSTRDRGTRETSTEKQSRILIMKKTKSLLKKMTYQK